MGGQGNKGGMWLIRLGMLLSIGALLWGSWVLWTHRQGTPGDPVGFYREVYRKSLETNSYVSTDEGKYPRRILVVNLSDSILAPEEQEELLGLLREDWPGLEVTSAPLEGHLHGRADPNLGEKVRLGEEEILLDDTVVIYTPKVHFMETIPSRESFGVQPIPVEIIMEAGGYNCVVTSFIHYPKMGWTEKGTADVFAHS